MIYLATPYSNSDPKMQEKNYQIALDVTEYFIQQDMHVYSPIVHNHVIAQRGKLPTDFAFWKNQNDRWLAAATTIALVLAPGYKESVGMQYEYAFAVQNVKKVIAVLPPYGNNWLTGKYYITQPLHYNPLISG